MWGAYLLNTNLKSNCIDQKLEAIRHLGLLQVGDGSTIYTLGKILENVEEDELIRYETAKSLILLGFWDCFLIDYLIEKLKTTSDEIKVEILACIIRGKYCTVLEDLEQFKKFISTLEELIDARNLELAQKACLCIGQLGVKHSEKAINKLVRIYEHGKDEEKKSLCLESLVRLFGKKDTKIIKFVIKAVHYAKHWTARISAAKLLSHIGANILSINSLYDDAYRLLLDRLSSDPIREVRLAIGESIKDLQMFDMAFSSIIKNLEHTDEEFRARSVISIEMLGVRKKKVIQNLIDMLELDSSEFVRTTVLKTLGNLAPNNPKVIQAFNNLEKSSKIYKIMMRMNEKSY
ncbi:hypothetical protein BpHYR1_002877 [Brachionus plicatilis]|uniref:HEAT repeat domain-containing protein n=1 Tax=Brachionus plicatilis TaxID=10195 RepID=A0A3M7P8Q5_BRAPC|nr:hypothetical protein BpHYR1_002877 [Brachionus plicatilis]